MYVPATLVRHAIGPLWAAWERSPYLRHYKRLLKTQFMNPTELKDQRVQNLRYLLVHAQTTVPFYRQRFAEARFNPDEITAFSDLDQLPLLTKGEIQESGPQLLSTEYLQRTDLARKRTSGSTGVSLTIWVDQAAHQYKRALTLRSDEWSGWRFGEPVALLWGNPDYLAHGWRGRVRNALLDRGTYLDTLKMSRDAMAKFADKLGRAQPSLLFGHAHSVYLFAEFLRGYHSGTIRPKGIITSAMILHDWQRAVIEEEFGCKVTNRYGSEEVSMIACECEQHQGLHVLTENVHVEILRDGQPALPGEPGSLIVTDLVNRAMPLIRYKIGDVASWSTSVCPCGRDGMPCLTRIEGREADFVTTPRGELISGISLTENFAMLVPGIAQIQIIQESVNFFRYRMVKSPAFDDKSLVRINELTHNRFGPEVLYECEFVTSIPQEPSGKYRFCISKVPNEFTRTQELVSRS